MSSAESLRTAERALCRRTELGLYRESWWPGCQCQCQTFKANAVEADVAPWISLQCTVRLDAFFVGLRETSRAHHQAVALTPHGIGLV